MDSLENQDRSTDVAGWVDGVRVGTVGPGEDDGAARLRMAGPACFRRTVEILKACADHPDTPAVDCLICAPE